jgi:hypothetical protein
MKNFPKRLAACLGLASLLCTACQPDKAVEPAEMPRGAARQAAAAGDTLSAITLPRHLLTRYGNATLSYNDSQRLAKVVLSSNMYRTYDRYWDESQQYLQTETYSGGKRIRKDVYALNASGRCTTSHTVYYDPHTGAMTSQTGYRYEYNGQNRLVKMYNISNPLERTVFYHNTRGNLFEMRRYSPSGYLAKIVGFYHSSNSPVDAYGFNPHEAEGLDPFLRAYGSFFHQLPRLCEVTYLGTGGSFTRLNYQYDLDAQGFPLTRRSYKGPSELVNTLFYEYQVVTSSVQ